MPILLYSFLGSLVVSLIAFIGLLTIVLREKTLHKLLLMLVGFSAGGLIGSAFFHIFPEALDLMDHTLFFAYVLIGFSLFFVLERVIHWRHCHNGVCDTHPFVYLNLVGDSIHNFIDGLIIVAAFTTSMHVGILTTFTIILHEIPQEFGDFAVLVHGGFSTWKALYFNFLTALFAVLGVFVGYFLVHTVTTISTPLLAFAAGGFIYIAASDLIPELHKEKDMKKSMISFLFFIFGVVLMWFFTLWFT